MTRYKTYSLNLRELVKAKNTSGIMTKDKPTSLNRTQVQIEQLKQNIGEWANAVFSGDQLKAMYPEPDFNKLKMDILHSYSKEEKL